MAGTRLTAGSRPGVVCTTLGRHILPPSFVSYPTSGAEVDIRRGRQSWLGKRGPGGSASPEIVLESNQPRAAAAASGPGGGGASNLNFNAFPNGYLQSLLFSFPAVHCN